MKKTKVFLGVAALLLSTFGLASCNTTSNSEIEDNIQDSVDEITINQIIIKESLIYETKTDNMSYIDNSSDAYEYFNKQKEYVLLDENSFDDISRTSFGMDINGFFRYDVIVKNSELHSMSNCSAYTCSPCTKFKLRINNSKLHITKTLIPTNMGTGKFVYDKAITEDNFYSISKDTTIYFTIHADRNF